jgi:plasmid segregation protein ParM
MKPIASKKAPEMILAADDNGYASHKTAYYNAEGKIECTKVDTNIQVGGSTLTGVGGEKEDSYHVYHENGSILATYTCSPANTSPLELRNSDYPFVEANRVLMHHALVASGLAGKSVAIGVTLPFRDYYGQDGSIKTGYVERSQLNFIQNNVVAEKGQKKVNITSAKVYPEGMSAFYDWAMDDECNTTAGYDDLDGNDGNALIVDIGGSTTDIVCIRMVNGNIKIDQGHSGTEKIGVHDVREQINSAYQKKYGGGHESSLSPRAIARIMETGSHRAGGVPRDLKSDVAFIIRGVTQRIVSYLRTKAGDINSFDVIHFVGGGAVLFAEELKKEVPIATLGDEFSNARGVLKYMKAQEAQQVSA